MKKYSSPYKHADPKRQRGYLWLSFALSICTCPVIGLMQHLKTMRSVFNKEVNEGKGDLRRMFISFGFYVKCCLRLLHPWPWLVGSYIHTGTVEKGIKLVYQSNDILHVVFLLYCTFSLVRFVDLSTWGRESKARIA